mmetsp:Transcript_30085/g.63448  ORF Transcript_30085/g.63448 Transcript_30085/m.63448 type:complete len:90 (+) Transcript_30085:34-303(+)
MCIISNIFEAFYLNGINECMHLMSTDHVFFALESMHYFQQQTSSANRGWWLVKLVFLHGSDLSRSDTWGASIAIGFVLEHMMWSLFYLP